MGPHLLLPPGTGLVLRASVWAMGRAPRCALHHRRCAVPQVTTHPTASTAATNGGSPMCPSPAATSRCTFGCGGSVVPSRPAHAGPSWSRRPNSPGRGPGRPSVCARGEASSACCSPKCIILRGSSANLVKPGPEAPQVVEVGRANVPPLVLRAWDSPKVRMSLLRQAAS